MRNDVCFELVAIRELLLGLASVKASVFWFQRARGLFEDSCYYFSCAKVKDGAPCGKRMHKGIVIENMHGDSHSVMSSNEFFFKDSADCLQHRLGLKKIFEIFFFDCK